MRAKINFEPRAEKEPRFDRDNNFLTRISRHVLRSRCGVWSVVVYAGENYQT